MRPTTPVPAILCFALLLPLAGCSPESDTQTMYRNIDPLDLPKKEKLPLAPHVLTLRARPTSEMMQQSAQQMLRFVLLDKRTLVVRPFDVPVGGQARAPWGGVIHPTAFASDLMIREGSAIHGPEGHLNPAAWVVLSDEKGGVIHEGWLFARDSAQTAWDHPRYDLTFRGLVKNLDG